MSIASLLTYFGYREKPASVSDLKFPVLVIPLDQSRVGVEPDAGSLCSAIIGSNLTPRNGTVVIDSDFNFYTQQNVKCQQGEMGMVFRAFVRPGKPMTFTMELKRSRINGLQHTLQSLVECNSIGEGDTPEKRLELGKQTTMAGIVEVLTRPIVFDAPP
jgi:hypothetical protein